MDRRIIYVIIALLSAALFFMAVGYASWGCAGSPLADPCKQIERLHTTGALLLTAGLVILLGGIFLILLVVMGDSWTEIAAAVATTAAAILAIAAVFYFYDKTNIWSPFIATIAMTLSIALAAVLLFDLISGFV